MVEGRFQKIEGTDFDLPCELVLLAMGFTGPERGSWLDRLGVTYDERGNVKRDRAFMTDVPGVFVAGDVRAESAKRVASAVGEGAMAVMLVHRYLERT